MENKITIYSADVHQDASKARVGVLAAAQALGVECNLSMSALWLIHVDRSDRAAFLELAREAANGD